MTILTILAAPSQDFSTRLFETFNKAVSDTHTIQRIDLYLENFDPVWRPEKPRSTEVNKYQDMVREADMIVFFYPVWWMNMPAILKGFLDQVFLENITYEMKRQYSRGLLAKKQAIVISTSNLPNWQVFLLYGNPLKLIWARGVLGFCGLRNVKYRNYDQVDRMNSEKKAQILEEVKLLGEGI